MPRKSAAIVPNRTLDDIRQDMAATKATCSKLKRFIDDVMSKIRSGRFQKYIVVAGPDGQPVHRRNPAFKELREYESTLRSAEKHLARLLTEESAAMKISPAADDQWADFAPKGNTL